MQQDDKAFSLTTDQICNVVRCKFVQVGIHVNETIAE